MFGAVVGCRNVGEEDMFGPQFPVVDDESGIFGGLKHGKTVNLNEIPAIDYSGSLG